MSARSPLHSLLWLLLLTGLTLGIGLRHEVGGYWGNYLPYVEGARWLSLNEAIFKSDPGYALLNWIGAHWGGGIYLVNTVCGLLFGLGLVALSSAASSLAGLGGCHALFSVGCGHGVLPSRRGIRYCHVGPSLAATRKALAVRSGHCRGRVVS